MIDEPQSCVRPDHMSDAIFTVPMFFIVMFLVSVEVNSCELNARRESMAPPDDWPRRVTSKVWKVVLHRLPTFHYKPSPTTCLRLYNKPATRHQLSVIIDNHHTDVNLTQWSLASSSEHIEARKEAH